MKRKHFGGIKQILDEIINSQKDSILVKEGLLYSYSSSYIFSHLKHVLNFDQSQIHLITGAESSKYFEINIRKENIINLNKLIIFMNNSCGWFSSFLISNDKNEPFTNQALNTLTSKLEKNILAEFKIRFEAKFDVEISHKKLPAYIFHVTLKEKLKRIERIGLKPTTNSKISSHPERIYFTLTFEDAEDLLNRFVKETQDKKEKKTSEDYCILKIFVPQLNENVVFFEDPMFMFFEKIGVYTLSNISSSAISLAS